jgi:hypothetical protein
MIVILGIITELVTRNVLSVLDLKQQTVSSVNHMLSGQTITFAIAYPTGQVRIAQFKPIVEAVMKSVLGVSELTQTNVLTVQLMQLRTSTDIASAMLSGMGTIVVSIRAIVTLSVELVMVRLLLTATYVYLTLSGTL